MSFPAKGEPLTLGDVSQAELGPKVQMPSAGSLATRPRRTSRSWPCGGAAGMPWSDIARISKGGPTRRNSPGPPTRRRPRLQLRCRHRPAPDRGHRQGRLAEGLGRRTGRAVPGPLDARPAGRARRADAADRPAVACKVQLSGSPGKAEAMVQVASTDESGTSWRAMGKFVLPVAFDESGKASWSRSATRWPRRCWAGW